MKLNTQAVNLAIVLSLSTIAAASWAHGLNSVTLSITALLILGGVAQTLPVRARLRRFRHNRSW
jgi:hypothetical protein